MSICSADFRACASSAAGGPRAAGGGGREPLVREERRIDPASEVAEILEGLRRLGLELRQHGIGLLRFASDERLREPELDRERDELLLRAVVDVALEAPALRVLRGDEPLLRRLQILESRAEVLRQPDVAENEPCLSREVGDELALRVVERIVRGHRDREGTEELSALFDGQRFVG